MIAVSEEADRFAVLEGPFPPRDDVPAGHPLQRPFLPGFPHRAFASVQPVASGRQFQILDRNAVGLERIAERAAVFRRDGHVILGMRQEGRRGLVGDLLLVGEAFDQLGRGIDAEKGRFGPTVGLFAHGDHGVDEQHEIGAAALAVDGVGRAGIAPVEVGAGGGGEVPSGRKAQDPDPPLIDLPRLRVCTDHANGTLGVEERNVGPALGEPVLEHNPGDSMFRQPLRNDGPFAVEHVPNVAPTRANDNRRAGRRLRRRGEHGHYGIGRFARSVTDRGRIGPELEFGRLGTFAGLFRRGDGRSCEQEYRKECGEVCGQEAVGCSGHVGVRCGLGVE